LARIGDAERDQLAYTDYDEHGYLQVFITTFPEIMTKQFDPKLRPGPLQWAPDGRRLVVVFQNEKYVEEEEQNDKVEAWVITIEDERPYQLPAMFVEAAGRSISTPAVTGCRSQTHRIQRAPAERDPASSSPPIDPAPHHLLALPERYTYDGSGSLVKSEVDGVITYYVGRHYHKTVDNGNVTIKKYYPMGMTQIVVRTIEGESDTLNWILTDHLSSAAVIANADGTLLSGQLSQMAEVGLMYFVARWADPLTGHFVQADTIVPELSNSGAWNRYGYSNYNPILYSDPSGHCAISSSAFINPLGIFSFYASCVENVVDAYNAYQDGETRIGVLYLEATGLKDLIVDISDHVHQMNKDVSTVFSDAPFSERIMPSVRVGSFAVGTAATVTGMGQAVKASLPALGKARLQAITNSANKAVGASPETAARYLSKDEIQAGINHPGVARMNYGKSVERLVARNIEKSPIDNLLYKHVGGPNNPDFVGRGILNGINFEITTKAQVAKHLARPYGPNLQIATYTRQSLNNATLYIR
jgi:RHS repeat-associated protein